MAYQAPRALIYEEFKAVPTVGLTIGAAYLVGGNASLIRFDNVDEKDKGALGFYDRVTDTTYDLPNRPAGAINDSSYSEVVVENALLMYFSDLIGAGSTITKVAGHNNRITSNNKVFASSTAAARSADFLDRDVKVGDVAKVAAVNGSGNLVTLWTTVKSLIDTPGATSIGSASSSTANAETSVASVSVTQTAGINNTVEATAGPGAAAGYDGVASGYISETYDIVVTQGSVNKDLTTARLRVISASGTDNVDSVTPSATGVATAIGTRGMSIVFTIVPGTDSLNAIAANLPIADFVVGQKWRVTVTQAFTKPVPTASGTYVGSANADYIVRVTRGGKYASGAKPQITVTTTDGTDVSGPTDVTAAATPVLIGTRGAQMAWSGTVLRKDDVYYVSCTGSAAGPIRTIELAHNLDTTIADNAQVELELFIHKPKLTITKNRIGYAPLVNWELNATQITLKSGILAYDDSWTSSGVKQALPLVGVASKLYGKAYLQTRYWLPTLANEVTFVDETNYTTLIPGDIHPDNPLKYGAFKALQCSGGMPVGVTAIADPTDLDDWATALEAATKDRRIGEVVPLSMSRDVQDLCAAHVLAMSAPAPRSWRKAWFALPSVPEIPIVAAGSTVVNHLEATTTDGNPCLCVVEDNPGAAGTQYTRVRCTSGNANFLTNGVRAGDIVRTQYTADGFGGTTYSTYVVDSVTSEDQIILVAGPASAIPVAAKVEVWRTLSANAEVTELVALAGSFGHRRIKAVLPEVVENGSLVLPGYFMCASLAGLRAGILPQRSLTRLDIPGYTSVQRMKRFTESQLDSLAAGGVFLVVQDPISGSIRARHAVTTADTNNLNLREEMVTAIADYVNHGAFDMIDPYIGQLNVNDANILRLRSELETFLDGKTREALNTDSGPPIQSYTIDVFERDALAKDQIRAQVSYLPAYALNNEKLTFVIG